MALLTVRKINEGDLVMTKVFEKARPMLIIKVTEDYVYGVPLSSQQNEFAFSVKALDKCRFLQLKKQYIHPTIHRAYIGGAMQHWMGYIDPASLKYVKKKVRELINEEIL